MQSLLQNSRRLLKVIQKTAGQPVHFAEITGVLQEVIGANALVLSRKGKILGSSIQEIIECPAVSEAMGQEEFPADFNQFLLQVTDTIANVEEAYTRLYTGPLGDCLFRQSTTTIVPIAGGGERLGTLLLIRKTKAFEEADLVIAEYGATVIGLEILRSKANQDEEMSRGKAKVQMALDTLSYSELEAVEHIFAELGGMEGLLVASKIADRVGITRSVIVNALRKFESAGVIESRSLGMKGTYIKILNEQLPQELAKMRKR